MGEGRLTPGLAFFAAGLGLLGVSAAIEAYLVLGGGVESGVVGGDLTRLILVPWAMGLVFFGYAYDRPEVLWDRARGRRVLATYALFADGGVHMLAIGEHIDLPVAALFFLILSPLQFVSAWLLIRGPPVYLRAWLVGGLGLIALYAASRLTALPFVEAHYRVEPLGIVSKGIEIVLVAAILGELLSTHRAARRPATRPAAQT